MKTWGDYDWPMLKEKGEGTDRRFRFRHYHGDKFNYGFLMDFDSLPYHEGERLLDMAYEVLGDITMYSVFTGNGYHIYVPVTEGIVKEEYRNYKVSYGEKMEEIATWLPAGVKIDTQPFNFHATGRVPGSLNGKNNEEVVLVDFHEGELIPTLANLKDKFTYREAPVSRRPVVLSEKSAFRPDLHCPFVRAVGRDEKAKGDYNTWSVAVGILAHAGRDGEAMELGTSTGASEMKVTDIIKRRDSFVYACSTIREEKAKGLGCANPCLGCPHGKVGGSSPSYVSGPNPTPAALHGFHLWADKTGLNTKRVDGFSIVNHWSNVHREGRIMIGNRVYEWEGTAFSLKGDLSGRAGEFPHDILRELTSVPAQDIQSMIDLTAVVNRMRLDNRLDRHEVEECDKEQYINMENGVFNVDTYELEAHHRDYLMLDQVNMAYDPQAECPRFDDFLHEVVPDGDDRQLLQVFFGLAMSNVPCEDHESALWMHGASGSGKTTLYRLMEMLFGRKLRKIGRKHLVFRENGLSFDFTGKSCVFVEDVKHDNTVWKDVEAFLTTYLSTKCVTVRRLYYESYDLCPKGALMFTSNDAPVFGSTEDGGFRRLRTLHFWVKPRERDTGLMEKFRKERNGIFLWALEGLKYYRKNGMPPLSPREEEERSSMEEGVRDNMEAWAKGVSFDPMGRVDPTAAWQNFLTGFGENRDSYNINRFSRNARKMLPTQLQKAANEIFWRTEQGRVWRIKL